MFMGSSHQVWRGPWREVRLRVLSSTKTVSGLEDHPLPYSSGYWLKHHLRLWPHLALSLCLPEATLASPGPTMHVVRGTLVRKLAIKLVQWGERWGGALINHSVRFCACVCVYMCVCVIPRLMHGCLSQAQEVPYTLIHAGSDWCQFSWSSSRP